MYQNFTPSGHPDNPKGSPPLGIYAKSSSAFGLEPAPGLGSAKNELPRIDPETGEIIPARKVYDPVATRLERFALQSAARAILPKSRTAKCLRFLSFKAEKLENDPESRKFRTSAFRPRPTVEVWRTKDTNTARYKNLQTCASVWACPVCAARISERRSAELRKAIDAHEAAGGQVLLLTLTNPHTRRDNLGDMLKAQAVAMSRFNGQRVSKLIWSDMGCIGTVRAWEVTHGRLRANNNGWHPHFHILIFCASGLDLDEFRSRIYSAWANSCRLAGLPIPSQRHGITLEDGSRASEYVSKGLWGLDREMTKGHIAKKAAHKGETPFDLLRSFLFDGDKQAAALFREFALTFHGRRQLVYSKGLKAHFDLEEKTDEEISLEVEESAELLGRITLNQWRAICRLDLRGEVLELARHGWAPVQTFLDQLPTNAQGINDS
jgi:hypothetical protein